MTTEWKMD